MKNDPVNPDLRQQALHWGRVCSRLSHESEWHGTRLVTRPTFTEFMVKNDIDAACAGAVRVRRGKFDQDGIAQEIEKLSILFRRGVITADEFERGKATFLGTPPDKVAIAIDMLSNLHDLRKQGALSESEFNSKKWEILSAKVLSPR